MCLGIPMQVVSIDGLRARCTDRGVSREVSLFLLQHEPVAVGDCVIVHVGYAIQKLSRDMAQPAWDLYDAMQQLDGSSSDA